MGPSTEHSTLLTRRQLVGSLCLGLAVLAVSGAGLWSLYDTSAQHLDRELGLRLQNVAVTAAATVPGDSLLVWWLAPKTPLDALLLTRQLERVELENQLAKIVVYQADRSVLLDTSHLIERGESDPFLALDLAAVEQAAVGIPSYSTLQRAGSEYMKAGYAPIFDAYDEVAGFIGVMASAGFFETLDGLRRRLFAVGAAVTLLVALLMGIYVGYARRLARARLALAQSERLSAMGRMAAGIAHEIRNPLGIIKNTAQLLRDEMSEAGMSTELVEFIPEEVDRLNETLTGYLEFARDDAPRFETVDLCQVVRRTLRLLQPDFQHGNVRVLDNLDTVGTLLLRIDPRRVQQVLLNLLLNAVQAMPEGGEVRVLLRAAGSSVELRIEDDGVGLDSAATVHLFEAFHTNKEKGSGLGLHMAQRIAEQHGGSLRLTAGASGRGAAAILELPRTGATRS